MRRGLAESRGVKGTDAGPIRRGKGQRGGVEGGSESPTDEV